ETLPPAEVAEVVRRTVFGGAEVVGLLGSGSAFYAPAASIAAMVGAVLSDTGAVLPSCVLLDGEYGLSGLHLNVPAALGRGGVREVVVWDLDATERTALAESAAGVAEMLASIDLHG
ncbi:MAG TPA: malate dehydrogenase, partial [Coriobacteriia bacterium]|nr:malate dehydrogenase [Coriobacteriia bacterium]